MKVLFLVFSFFATVAFSQEQNKVIEAGLYKALDVDTGTVDCTLQINEDQTVLFDVKTEDFSMPEPGCAGTYKIEGNVLSADMECPIEELSGLNVKIDITNVTPESVRTEQGAPVKVQLDAFGPDMYDFTLRKVQ